MKTSGNILHKTEREHNMNETIKKLVDELAVHAENFDRRADRMCNTFINKTEVSPLLLLNSPHPLMRETKAYNPLEIHFDSDKMLQNELRAALSVIISGSAAVPSVRANMGCGIVPALFGIKPELFVDKMPWIQSHLPKEAICEMTEEDIKITPEFRCALDHMEYFTSVLRGCGVRVYPVDIQGAFDTAHLVYGDDIYYQLYDDPEFVHHLLKLSVKAIKIAYDECKKRIDNSDKMIAHYNSIVMPEQNGAIKLSEDTSTLLSKPLICEFVIPYIREIFDYTGGGYIHYCGYNEHLYEAVINESGVRALNFGNPEKHNMESVLGDLSERGIFYYGAIPKKPDENNFDYFRRLQKASYNNGKYYLMLVFSCTESDAESTVDNFYNIKTEV